MKTEDFENLVQAYLSSRLGLDGESLVDASILIDIFILESEFLICATALFATLAATEKQNIVPFVDIDMRFMNSLTISQIAAFCEVFASIKRSQLVGLFDSLDELKDGIE